MRRLLAIALLVGCGSAHEPGPAPPVLLYAGTGTSDTDVEAIEALLDAEHIAYETATTSELDAMSSARLRAHRLLIVPGGNFVAMGDALGDDTPAKIHAGVASGLGYLGFCAGAFLAGHFPMPYHGLDLARGAQFHFYAAEARGVRRAAVPITTPDGAPLDVYWEDGPELSGWGEPIAAYPDGTPAVVQGASGNGWVVLSGVHPEAPAAWRDGLAFGTSIDADHAYAITLIRAALDHTRLRHLAPHE